MSRHFKSAFSLLALAALCGTAAGAQTDLATSLYETFGSTASYNADQVGQRPANAAGGLFEFRHIRSPLVGYEAAYSFNRANQVYAIALNSAPPDRPPPSALC